MKRLFDLLLSSIGLVLGAPVIIPAMMLVWLHDYHSPLYMAPRVGKNGAMFRMIKLRSMVVNADRSGVDSTSGTDPRITRIGHFIRRYKLDELMQLWNVLTGTMSLVGPRPNVQRETDLYTAVERRLLSVNPGITDFASIVFADEGEILKDASDPDIAYNQLIRPWKSRLGLIYVDHQSFLLDVRLVTLTAVAIVSRRHALRGVENELIKIGVPEDIVRIARRQEILTPYPPPGADTVVTSR